MYPRKPKRFRRHQNGRGRPHHSGVDNQNRMRPNSFSNGHSRNNFRSFQSAEKLLAKYNILAKEALSSGDKTSCENFLQHADHFIRIIEEKKNRDQSKNDTANKSTTDGKISPDNEVLEKNSVINNNKE